MQFKNFVFALVSVALAGCSASDFDLESAYTPYEADILSIKVCDPSILDNQADSVITVVNDMPQIRLASTADMSNVKLAFNLTPGSTIGKWPMYGGSQVDAKGHTFDFSETNTVSLMVTSENAESHHVYNLSVEQVKAPTVVERFSFERYELNNPDGTPHYYIWYDNEDSDLRSWDSANGGFGISKSKTAPEDYPTAPCEGYEGKGVVLTTSSPGAIAERMGVRLAAGNFFIGTFNVTTALKDPLTSTRFGMTAKRKPLRFRGWMNYVPGEKFQDKNGKIVPNERDTCNIYAIFYRNVDENGNAVVVDGATVENNKYIVARVDLDSELAGGTDGEWKYFDMEMDYDNYPCPYDPEVLRRGGYSISLIGSSSSKGGEFCGAIGSALKIDEFEIVYEEE